jgi:hypothetical protein
MSSVIRMTFEHNADGVTLVSRQRVEMTLPAHYWTKAAAGGAADAADAAPAAFVAEVRNADGEALHRTAIPNPLEEHREVFSEEPGRSISRIPVGQPEGAFTVLVPDRPDADHVSLLVAPPTRDPATGSAMEGLADAGPREIGRFSLRDADGPDGDSAMTIADGQIVGTTKIVDNGPASQRWNIAIMGDGYQAAQLGQYATDVQAIVNTFLATPPFDALRPGINVFRIDVSSTDSGAADPVACGGTGAAPHTYFDSRFCGDGQIRRLVVANNQTALATAAAQVPQFHLAIVLVNSTIYGGSGGQVAVLSTANGAAEIALHEIGHSAFGLADEYEYWAGCGVDAPGTHDHHPAAEPAQPNVTINANRATNKWRGLVLNTTAMPTTSNANCAQCDAQASPVQAATVGAFEGAHYYHCGAFRPSFNCRMRALGLPVLRGLSGRHPADPAAVHAEAPEPRGRQLRLRCRRLAGRAPSALDGRHDCRRPGRHHRLRQ